MNLNAAIQRVSHDLFCVWFFMREDWSAHLCAILTRTWAEHKQTQSITIHERYLGLPPNQWVFLIFLAEEFPERMKKGFMKNTKRLSSCRHFLNDAGGTYMWASFILFCFVFECLGVLFVLFFSKFFVSHKSVGDVKLNGLWRSQQCRRQCSSRHSSGSCPTGPTQISPLNSTCSWGAVANPRSPDPGEKLGTGLSPADLRKWILNSVPMRSGITWSRTKFLSFITWKPYKAL